MKEKQLYKFGEFTLDVESHALNRDGETIPVTPKMFDLLLVLVQHPGRVLGKDFLLKTVWPDSFVEEGNITFNIRQLRKALGDSTQSPLFIETVPRRGYRFVADVERFTVASDEPDTIAPGFLREALPEPVGQPSSETPGPRRNVLAAVSVFVILASAVSLGGWLLRNREPGTAPILATPFKSEKLSTDGGVFHIALSPDGKNVVYTHRSGGKQALWLRQLETSNNVPIVPPSDEFYGGLAISPDGNSVYFVRGSQQGPYLSVYRMPIFGGVPQKIIDGTQGWISLSPKGDRISFIRCAYTDEEWCALFVADSLDGQNEKKLTARPRPVRMGDNKISPDGKKIALAVGQSRTASNEFRAIEVDIETGAERDLTPEKFFNINYFAWLPDQSGVLMTARQIPDRNFQIWHVNSAGVPRKLTADSETYSRLGLDAAGKLLVSTQVEPDFRLMIFQTDNPTAPPRLLGNANTVAFAPDGKVYFSSARTGDGEIWTANVDGSDLRQLTNNPSGESAPLISADARTVYFQSDRTGSIQLWRMNADGSNQAQLTREEGGNPVRISPDARWLYYRSALNGTLRRVALDTGEEQLVLKEMGRGIIVSPDATKVAFSQRNGQDTILSLASLPDGAVIKTWRIAGAPNMAHLVWSNDGQYLAYILTDDPKQIGSLWFQNLNEDAPKQIADLSGDEIFELQGFAIASDGRSFGLIKGNWKHDAVLFRGLK